ncbi:hypothetical protein KS4_21560 [Poriferisphaera corsica]|uniref:Uncharacterized protein n=1 Tax=Poriferisphaera corsica TaxID=2528020 RepID=A0A517YV48_9BACT|nr:hypothetical protein [Poriferisphaera corsica]QDU34094.1 hypothetical protein KS4_21560 [Poriferisphaera corsica]
MNHHILSILSIFLFTLSPALHAQDTANAQQQYNELLEYITSVDEPITLEDFASRYPTSPDNQANNTLAALKLIKEPEPNKKPKNALPFVQYESSIESILTPIPSHLKPIIDEHLARNKPALTAIRNIDFTKPCQYPIKYTDGIAALLPHLSQLRQAMHLLRLDIYNAYHTQDHARVYDNILTILNLAESLKNEPIAISLMVRISIISTALQLIEPITHNETIPADYKTKIITSLQPIDLHSIIPDGIMFDRTSLIDISIDDFKLALELGNKLPEDLDESYYVASKHYIIYYYTTLIDMHRKGNVSIEDWRTTLGEIPLTHMPAKFQLLHLGGETRMSNITKCNIDQAISAIKDNKPFTFNISLDLNPSDAQEATP